MRLLDDGKPKNKSKSKPINPNDFESYYSVSDYGNEKEQFKGYNN